MCKPWQYDGLHRKVVCSGLDLVPHDQGIIASNHDSNWEPQNLDCLLGAVYLRQESLQVSRVSMQLGTDMGSLVLGQHT